MKMKLWKYLELSYHVFRQYQIKKSLSLLDIKIFLGSVYFQSLKQELESNISLALSILLPFFTERCVSREKRSLISEGNKKETWYQEQWMLLSVQRAAACDGWQN